VGGALAAGALLSSIGFAAQGQDVEPRAHTETLSASTPVEAQQPQTVDAKLVAEQRAHVEAERLRAEAQRAAEIEAQRAAEAEARRPKSVMPVPGRVSSTYGPRWGSMHAGIDFADRLGTPIAAVTDGTVIEAGPASGFGLWIRIQQDDGTIGVYGHVNDMFVRNGQHVRAGDIIGTVGNRGQSTGPHLHYEVWKPGDVKVDPLPWLAARGLHTGGNSH
jgi:murein DD-endopeptidase MepM/ murein hydrolase activator NlpD